MDNANLILDVMSKWRKSKKYQLTIQPAPKQSPNKKSNNNNNDGDIKPSLLAAEEQRDVFKFNFIIYYNLL